MRCFDKLSMTNQTLQYRHREPQSGVAIQSFTGLLHGACTERSRSVHAKASASGEDTSRLLKNYLILVFTTLMSGFAQWFNPPSPLNRGELCFPLIRGRGLLLIVFQHPARREASVASLLSANNRVFSPKSHPPGTT